jgi:hypothetical protein
MRSSEETFLMATGRQCFTNDVGVPFMSYYGFLEYNVIHRQVFPPSASSDFSSCSILCSGGRYTVSVHLTMNPISTNGHFSHSPPRQGRACFQLAANQSYVLSYVIIIINRFASVKCGVSKNKPMTSSG